MIISNVERTARSRMLARRAHLQNINVRALPRKCGAAGRLRAGAAAGAHDAASRGAHHQFVKRAACASLVTVSRIVVIWQISIGMAT